MRGICLRWQDVRGGRLVFSCECAGVECPDMPVRALYAPSGDAQGERAHGVGTAAQGSSAGDEEGER